MILYQVSFPFLQQSKKQSGIYKVQSSKPPSEVRDYAIVEVGMLYPRYQRENLVTDVLGSDG